jgi:hypothetical protein
MIPGSNLLNMALSVIAKQSVQYFKFAGRTTNAIGNFGNTYDAPTTLQGSWQFVPRALYQQYGLDLQKSYATFYVSANVVDIAREVAGDQLTFNGRRYQVESTNSWFAQDGWVGVLCVDIGAT